MSVVDRSAPSLKSCRTGKISGFTLLEVLVALAVFAIAAGALTTGLTESKRTEGYLERQIMAHWVSMNQLSITRMQAQWPDIGIVDGKEEMAGIEWRWTRKVSGTSDPKLRRIDVEVRLNEKETPIAQLAGFITQEPIKLASASPSGAPSTNVGSTPNGELQPDDGNVEDDGSAQDANGAPEAPGDPNAQQ